MMGVAIGLVVAISVGEAGRYWKVLCIVAGALFVWGLLLLLVREDLMRGVGGLMMTVAVPLGFLTALGAAWSPAIYFVYFAAALFAGGLVLFLTSPRQPEDGDN